MAAFKFRLERILRLRETMEEKAKHAWGRQTALLYESRELLALLRQEKEDVRTFGYGQGDLNIKQAMYNYLALLDQKIAAQTEVVRQREHAAEKARQAWLFARGETKKIAILRDKEYNKFIHEELRKEQKVLDDMRPYLQK